MVASLVPLGPEDVRGFKDGAQRAFQSAFEARFGRASRPVLPERDIDSSMNAEGSEAYRAVLDGRTAGGAIVTLDPGARRGHLEILYVEDGFQGRGVGRSIWEAIEGMHPEVEVWETYTPVFDLRNVHFYVNVCGFHVVEFFNRRHPMPDVGDDFIGDGG